MEKFKERLILEYRNLIEKINSLEITVYGNKNNDIPKEHMELLERQLKPMYEYREILEERILLLMK